MAFKVFESKNTVKRSGEGRRRWIRSFLNKKQGAIPLDSAL